MSSIGIESKWTLFERFKMALYDGKDIYIYIYV